MSEQMGNKQGRRCNNKSVKLNNNSYPATHANGNNDTERNICVEEDGLLDRKSPCTSVKSTNSHEKTVIPTQSHDVNNVHKSTNQACWKQFSHIVNGYEKVPQHGDEFPVGSFNQDDEMSKYLGTSLKNANNDQLKSKSVAIDYESNFSADLDGSFEHVKRMIRESREADKDDTEMVKDKDKCPQQVQGDKVASPRSNLHVDNATHDFDSFVKNVEKQDIDNNSVQKLKSLVQQLTSDRENWIEILSKLSKIIRGQTDVRIQSECVSVLINFNFPQKLNEYLEIKHVNSMVDLKFDVNPEAGRNRWAVVKKFLMLLWIVCDQNVNFCQYFLTTKLFEFLVVDFKKLCITNYAESEVETFVIKAILGILHNISRLVPNSKWTMRNLGLVSDVKLLLVSEVPMIRLKSLMVLSYILSEAENEVINSDNDNFIFIFQVLSDALKSPEHKSSKYGMTAAEVLKGLNNLAINDENKIRIVQNGGLPLFQEVLTEGHSDEVKVTITTLWSLAFHHYNKVKMRELPGIMSKLYDLQQCDNEEICHAARGTFWELENTSKSSINTSLSSSLSADKDPSQPHIMISYQWDSQSVMMKVKDRLRRAGYKVWMDIEHMTGSTLEAMALAVEKAAVVLVCMSQKYKDSPNCRTEAEYVYRLRKDFVPLRLQREYIPDGWLGILVGTRLYFDIYEEDQLDVQIPRLVRELRNRGKIQCQDDSVDYHHVPVLAERLNSRDAAPLLHHPASPTVSSWSCSDVKQWLISHGLDNVTTEMEQFDGHLLIELKHIQDTAPEYFHKVLRQDLKLSLISSLTLSKFLRDLI